MADEPHADAKPARPSAGARRIKQQPDAPTRARAGQRTGLIVAAGMILLAAVGVGTIFADPILAALRPPAADGARP